MNNYFSKNLIAIREVLRMEQKEFAKYVGIAPSNICRYEKGKLSPKVDVVFQIADKLNISVGQLVAHDLSLGIESDEQLQILKDEIAELNQERLGLKTKARMDDEHYGQCLTDATERYIALVEIYEKLTGKKIEREDRKCLTKW